MAVYCGSTPGRRPEYAEAAAAVGRLLGGRGITVVYGGGSRGLMGRMADAALESGGRVVGVIPRGLFHQEVAHQGISELIEVDSMHERKLLMYELSDAFLALPGGIGTLEELTEMLSWANLGLHRRPVVTFNVGGFWDPFHRLLAHAAEAGFVDAACLELVADVSDLDQVAAALHRRPPPRGAHPASIGIDET